MISNKSFKEKILKTKYFEAIYFKLNTLRYKIRYYLINDERMNRKLYKKFKGVEPNIDNPKNFSEKLQFLKLHYRNPLQTLCADKYYVGEYIKACGFEHILKKTFAVYDDAKKIDLESLPETFFLKCNHVSGNNMVVHKNEVNDIRYLKFKYNNILKRNHYYSMREWCYKNIKPLIICEELLIDSNGNLPIDYKFYCFSGEPKYFMVSVGEYEHNVRNHKFDMELKSIDHYFKKSSGLAIEEINLPENFNEMITIVKKLCEPFPHVRVDLYNINGKIYFGELTFYSNGGFVDVYSEEMDNKIGSWIKLDKYKFDMI